jgi:iron complex outermembrane receptor protein
VTAGRLPTAPAQAPTRITVVDSTALARTGAASVASALQQRTGLFVRRYGATGLATPALRGSGASQTALLLDGQPITNPQLGHLDLSLLPTVLLRSMAVMHGPASPIHGTDALGGAIHLHSLRPRAAVRVRGSAHVGAYGTRGGSLLVGGPVTAQTAVLAAADLRATDGDFPYVDEARFPPKTVRRRNADRTRRSVFGSVQTRQGAHRLRLSGWLTTAERGLPPSSSTAPAQERQWDTQLRLWGRDRIRLGKGLLTVRGMTQHSRLRYADPQQGLDQTGRTRAHSLASTFRTPLTSRWTTAVGATGGLARARHPRLDGHAHQEHVAAFAEGTGTYGRLRLYPALRADAYWMPESRMHLPVTPRLGLNWAPLPAWPSLRLKAHVARAFRVPTFNDRYWQPGGNPALRPERSWGADVGLRLDRRLGHVELTAFAQRRRDQIVWRPTGTDSWSPRNVERVRALGLEASGKRTWLLPAGAALRTGLTYTFTDARTRTDPASAAYNAPLRYVPRTQVKGHSTLTWGPAALTVHARYTGRRPVTSDGRQFLPPYVMAGTRVSLHHTFAGVRTALSLDVDNLLDTDYQSVDARPMPPRHMRVRLSITP